MANFNNLTSSDKVAELIEQSNRNPVLFFKHSTTCPISASVYGEVSRTDLDVNLIVMQTARPVSEELAKQTGVRHESPQAIVVKNGEVVYHASHFDVTAEDLTAAFEG